MGWLMGIEPTTPCSTGRCSNQLSYSHHFAVLTFLIRQRKLALQMKMMDEAEAGNKDADALVKVWHDKANAATPTHVLGCMVYQERRMRRLFARHLPSD